MEDIHVADTTIQRGIFNGNVVNPLSILCLGHQPYLQAIKGERVQKSLSL